MEDFKNWRWRTDINRFTMMKVMLIRVKDLDYDWAIRRQEHLRKLMHDIQKKWPQYIKIDEIP